MCDVRKINASLLFLVIGFSMSVFGQNAIDCQSPDQDAQLRERIEALRRKYDFAGLAVQMRELGSKALQASARVSSCVDKQTAFSELLGDSCKNEKLEAALVSNDRSLVMSRFNLFNQTFRMEVQDLKYQYARCRK